jgi:Zn-dependent protease
MRFSLKIARLAGIDVFVHWTFLILIVWVVYSQMNQGQTFEESLWSVWFILALFACVVLHELGHALTARRYGIQTRNIILLPIGGVANLEKMPDNPVQELKVALAGPAVNVVIAALLFVILYLTDGFPDPESISEKITLATFLPALLVVNIMLVVFNLIPAFPMDGGRVLRALLSMRFGRARATGIAAQLGQFLGIAFVVIGLFMGQFLLPIIGIFIYLGAGAESNYEAVRSVLANFKVGDVVMRNFTTLHAWERIDKAVQLLLDGQDKDFLVEEDNVIIGVLTREDIIRGLRDKGRDTLLKHIANPDFVNLSLHMGLQEAFDQLNRSGSSIGPVYDENNELAGILNTENVKELIMVQDAVNARSRSAV